MTLNRTLGIIGSAGRDDDAARVDADIYGRMMDVVRYYVGKWSIDTAVSGGAAFADHLAVSAYLQGVVSHLVLYLPADFSNSAYVPNPSVRFNPGKTSNNYHRQFEAATGVKSLAEINEAIAKGAEVHVFPGFHRRNSEVADHSNFLLAFTFGDKTSLELSPEDDGYRSPKCAGLKDGGTAHTFSECWKAEAKAHISLFDLKRQPAEVLLAAKEMSRSL